MWRHGYGRWQAIVDEKDLRVQEVICQELNLPFITLPVPGASQTQDGSNRASTETPGSQTTGTGAGNNLAPDATPAAPDAANRAQIFQDSSVLYHFREMQRRQVEFIKKRVLLLEKALTAEYQKEVFVSSFTSSATCLFWSLVWYMLKPILAVFGWLLGLISFFFISFYQQKIKRMVYP